MRSQDFVCFYDWNTAQVCSPLHHLLSKQFEAACMFIPCYVARESQTEGSIHQLLHMKVLGQKVACMVILAYPTCYASAAETISEAFQHRHPSMCVHM